MRRRRKVLALGCLGLALLAIPILMLTMLFLRHWNGGMEAAGRTQQEMPTVIRWQTARDPAQGSTISYPEGWVMEPGPPLVVRASESGPVGLLVVLEAATPLPRELAEWLSMATEPIHVAHNVAVSNLSGTETIYLPPDASARLASEAILLPADPQLMVVLWESSETPLRVYLVTTDQGTTLATLAQMRSTLQWER